MQTTVDHDTLEDDEPNCDPLPPLDTDMLPLTARMKRFVPLVVLALVAFDLPTPGGLIDEPQPIVVAPTERVYNGTVLAARPPSLRLPDPSPTAEAIRAAMQASDTDRALRLARQYVEEQRWGRTRDAVWLLIGLLERERGHANDASEAFTKVRAAEGPLAQFGAYYEAEQDLVRGKPSVAIGECEQVRQTWPDGPHDAECLRIQALGWARVGHRSNALEAAVEFDKDHPVGPITEQIELALAEGLAVSDPSRAIPALQRLAVQHHAPLTGRIAEALLTALNDEGHADSVVPDDTPSLQARARSLRDAGRYDETWAIWAELERRAQDDPHLTAWLDANISDFAWRLRNWDALTEVYETRYAESGNAALAWRLHRVWSRAGDFDKATHWVAVGRAEHANQGSWRHSEDVQAQAYLLGGQYDTATELLDIAASRRGWSARRARFRSAFSAFMGGHHQDAIERLTGVIEAGRGDVAAATYWRARAYDALDEHDAAAADREWLNRFDDNGWYGQLAASPRDDAPSAHPFARDGRWPGASLPTFEPIPERSWRPATSPQARPEPVAPPSLAQTPVRLANAAFQTLQWSMLPPSPVVAQRPIAPELTPDLTRPPASYGRAPIYQPQQARIFARDFADAHADGFPLLQAAVDMAEVGLYDLSGPLLATVYEDVALARRRRSHAGHSAALRIPTDHAAWRQVFLYTRDHHHAARFTYGLHENFTDLDERQSAQRLTYPLAYDRFVWDRAQENGIDPYLVLSLMRQESVYDPNALSRVGARGAMQIMPRTGHRLADLTANIEYTAADLEDPIVSIGLGVTYLARLMERFDGVYPLAIASYNGGPHNVSAWMQGTGTEMPMDAFVEHIPFKETRGYVQSVSAHYATYLDLYAPEGTVLVIPPNPAGDHPEVVDF